MNIYLISQCDNSDYDTYDSAVVFAPNEAHARNMDPKTGELMTEEQWAAHFSEWCSSSKLVTVELLGTAGPKARGAAVVCSSYNAG